MNFQLQTHPIESNFKTSSPSLTAIAFIKFILHIRLSWLRGHLIMHLSDKWIMQSTYSSVSMSLTLNEPSQFSAVYNRSYLMIQVKLAEVCNYLKLINDLQIHERFIKGLFHKKKKKNEKT